MTPLEMHIGVNVLYQKINSNYIFSVKPEEMDLLLNNEVMRYINSKSRPKFQNEGKHYEDLKALIGPPVVLSSYVRDDDSVFSFFPSNCLRVIKSRSIVKDLCGATYSPTTTSASVHYAVYKLLNSGVNNYQAFVFKINGVEVFKTSDYPQFSSGLAAAEMKFELIRFMLEAIRLAGYQAKYENYDSLFYRESIIISNTSSFTYTTIYNAGTPTVVSSSGTSYTKISAVSPSKTVDNVLVSTEDYNIMLNSEFGTTLASAPIAIYENGRVSVFHKKKFIVASVSLDFIRFPRIISLPLNQSCDLDPSVHDEIVDNLAKRLAAVTSAENYQQLLRENLLKE